MKNRVALHKNQKKLLNMIYDLSAGKGYMYYDQAIRLALHFKVYKTEAAMRMAVANLLESGDAVLILSDKNYKVRYKIIALTHLGSLQIRREIKKKIDVKPITLDIITRRAGYIMKMSPGDIKSFSEFRDDLQKNLSTLFFNGIDDGLAFMDRMSFANNECELDRVSELQTINGIDTQKQYLEYIRTKLWNNLRGENSEILKSAKPIANIFDLAKRYIYISSVYRYEAEGIKILHPIFVKIIPGSSKYNAEKMMDDIDFVMELKKSVFGAKTGMNFVVVFQDEKSKRYTKKCIDEYMKAVVLNEVKKAQIEERVNYIGYIVVNIDKYTIPGKNEESNAA